MINKVKGIALFMAAGLVLMSCGNKPNTESLMVDEPENSEAMIEEAAQTEDSEAVDEETAEAKNDEDVSEDEANEDEVLEENVEIVPNDTVEFAKNLKFGWNLGNTLDATGSAGMSSETSWGQPKVTKELIHYIKESGFTTIRIPVSWGKHTSGSDYAIDSEWMARVKEIVDYAISEDLYVIINSHHDCDYYYPSDAKLDESMKYIESVWTQISEEFKDYDEHLIFESMNEPRLKDTDKEWWFNENDSDGCASIRCIVKLNQKFVDIVRASGGNNSNRYLMVPSHAASPDTALNKNFEAPVDPSGRIMISVHAYTPYDFAMNASGYSNWDKSKESDLGFMKRLSDKFIANGYGVVIGEFGSTNKDNLSDRIAWAESYTRKSTENQMPCILWDNGATGVGEENFGMVDRNNLKIYFPELLDAYMQYYK